MMTITNLTDDGHDDTLITTAYASTVDVGARDGHGVVTVLVTGEVDMVTVDLMRARLRHALSLRSGEIVIDLTYVTFFSAAGLSLLLDAQSAAVKDGIKLRLRGVKENRCVLRVLVLTGLLSRFTLY